LTGENFEVHQISFFDVLAGSSIIFLNLKPIQSKEKIGRPSFFLGDEEAKIQSKDFWFKFLLGRRLLQLCLESNHSNKFGF